MNRWILASRPKTLVAAIAPVCLGVAYSFNVRTIDVFVALLILVDAVLIQIVTNFANDVIDFERGADTETRIGPQRMTQAGLIEPEEMWLTVGGLLTVISLIGLYLVWLGGLPILLIGISALVLSIAYTGGPFPLAYNGLGDVFTLLYFGPIALCGTVFLLTGEVPAGSVILGLSCGLLATAFLVVNNIRDHEGDRLARKRTLVVRFGVRFGELHYLVCLLGAILLPLLAAGMGIVGEHFFYLAFLLPPSLILSRRIFKTAEAKEYNLLLASTGRFYWLFLLLTSLVLLSSSA